MKRATDWIWKGLSAGGAALRAASCADGPAFERGLPPLVNPGEFAICRVEMEVSTSLIGGGDKRDYHSEKILFKKK
jgi:hypothetical protein